jgi:hypothetical protein
LSLNDYQSFEVKNKIFCAVAPSITSNINEGRDFCKKISGTQTPLIYLGGENYLMK